MRSSLETTPKPFFTGRIRRRFWFFTQYEYFGPVMAKDLKLSSIYGNSFVQDYYWSYEKPETYVHVE